MKALNKVFVVLVGIIITLNAYLIFFTNELSNPGSFLLSILMISSFLIILLFIVLLILNIRK